VGGTCGRNLWEAPVGGICGRHQWEASVGGTCRRDRRSRSRLLWHSANPEQSHRTQPRLPSRPVPGLTLSMCSLRYTAHPWICCANRRQSHRTSMCSLRYTAHPWICRANRRQSHRTSMCSLRYTVHPEHNRRETRLLQYFIRAKKIPT
jgi:hypothetical protein